MFFISWVTTYVANDAAKNLICSWNHHRIPGPQGCVPGENMQLPAAELIPPVSETVKMCEERGGSLACDATFGTDPLVMRADLIKSHEWLFFSMQSSGQNILICWCAWSKCFVDVTTYLAGYSHWVSVSLLLWGCFFWLTPFAYLVRNKILVSAGHEKTMLWCLNLLIGYKLISYHSLVVHEIIANSVLLDYIK